MKKFFYLFNFLICFQLLVAQSDTISLSEVNLSDSYLKRYNLSRSQILLSDSVIQRNGTSLTNLINFNSTIYLKENGLGMVSSPSFRGTTAQQTAIIWNGINVNSAFLGMTDFNTINPNSFDEIVIQSGGSSMGYGSGAIGGSIHLTNNLNFHKGFQNQLLLSHGSFTSYQSLFRSAYSDDNLSFQISLGRNGADNDFEFVDKSRKNSNGQFYNNLFNLAVGYKLNDRNYLKFYGNISDVERHFSLISPNATPTKYHDYNTRSLVEWNSIFGKFESKFKMAYLKEEYRYYPQIQSSNYTFGEANTFLTKYDLAWKNRNVFLNAIIDYTNTQGEGSDIVGAERNLGSASLVLQHQVKPNFIYNLSLRQEISDEYRAPFLYSVGLNWKLTSFYDFSINASKNFRMPTFNDLYWPGSGNLDLKPEISYQGEVGNHFTFGAFSGNLNGFFNSIENLISWIPGSGGVFSPENTYKVQIYGLEALFNFKKHFGVHKVEWNGSYSYTVSENELTKKQLIYVPFHRATSSLNYNIKFISMYYQFMWNGKVFTDYQNNTSLDPYTVSNLGLEVQISKLKDLRLGGQILNLWNKDYQNVLNRPMPGRNYNVYLNFKF